MVLATEVFLAQDGNIFFVGDGRSQGKKVVLAKLGLLYSYNLTSLSTALLAFRGSIAV